MTEHDWSGWPGAWCLDCGAEDLRESCLAGNCGVLHAFDAHALRWVPDICVQEPCPYPGERRHDPYRRGLSRR